jgi:O-methyltransferase
MQTATRVRAGLRSIARRVLRPGSIPLQEYARNRPQVLRTWLTVNRRSLTYSSPRQLAHLVRLVSGFERRNVPGEIIETGCAWGGSAILMCSAKSPQRPMRVFDVFGMIPPPSEKDGNDMKARYEEIAAGRSRGLGNDPYYAYDTDLKTKVRNNFRDLGYPIEQNNVSLIAGKVQDTLEVTGPVCLAHIDVDWYEPVMASLERIVPFLAPSGVVALRAYSDWSGCRRATDEYLERVGSAGYDRKIVDGELFVRRRP